MPKIFISYRRNDSRTITGRIYDRLSAEFGSDNIFRDINAIPLGSDFPTVIKRELASCDFLLAIIGLRWVSITDEQGRRRLNDPNDFVRIEVETALRLPDVTVIPVYVDGVPGLSSSDLPPTLANLPRRNAAFVRDDPDFHSDVDKLIASIRKIAPISEPIEAANVPKSSPTANALGGKFIIGILALIVVIVVIVTIASVLNPRQGVIPTPTPPPTQVIVAASATITQSLTPTDAPTLTLILTPEPSLTPLPPSATLSPTSEPIVTPLPANAIGIPSKTPIPTIASNISVQPTPIPSSLTPTTVKSYPCEGIIIGNNSIDLNVVHANSSKTSPLRYPIKQGSSIIIHLRVTVSANELWYQISDTHNIILGWILSDYVNPMEDCP